eukprot:gnl/Chilomastix_caulleri/4861.p1 GENE.gnl/Chilomastix_caulleri/4861~~gnl/Chilomastix_caulleri/4861.p1  ORF type:complete len:165 (+),score=53.12 gnl/Chilomastix_caulleri/4861:77-571(+)
MAHTLSCHHQGSYSTGITEITSIPDTQTRIDRRGTVEQDAKRTPTAFWEVRKEIVDIAVALDNLEIKIGRILAMCLDIKPVPRFVPMLAKCTNNYDVFIKAKFFNEPDLTINQILEEQTDYRVIASGNGDGNDTDTRDKKRRLNPERFYDEEYLNQYVGRREGN